MALNSEAERLWRAAQSLAADVDSSLPPLLFFTDPTRTPCPWITAGALPRGAAVVHRGFGRPDTAETARRLRHATRQSGVLLLIGQDAALAEDVAADGIHLAERDAGRATDLRSAQPNWRFTAAWHPGSGPPPRTGALDALVVSPVFQPGGASSGTPLGREGLANAVRASSAPVYALGGLDAENIKSLAGTGVCGVAAVEAIQAAFKPSRAGGLRI